MNAEATPGSEAVDLIRLGALYDAYVDTYRGEDGALPELMQLKRTHTAMVVRNAECIADRERFDAQTRQVAVAAALLHDTGRYEQLRRYNTFRDSDSVDHAVFSHEIVRTRRWLEKACPDATGDERVRASCREAVLKAILYHNRRALPGEIEDPPSSAEPALRLLSLAAHTVRDADKLDIFRVLEQQIEHTDWRRDSRAFWNLKTDAPPSPEVVACIERGRPVDYQEIRVLADFVLIQIGWMMSELHFATSRQLCAERNHLAFRRRFLHELTDDPVVDRLCDLAAGKIRAASA